MEAVNFILVEVDNEYNNEINGVIINSTVENVECINRIATVISAPEFTILQKGDKIMVHHNVTRKKNDVKGNTIKSDFHIEDNLYFVPLDATFMYKRDESDWVSIDPYCFLKPISAEESEGFALSIAEGSYKGMKYNVGTMWYPNKHLSQQGAVRGDKVAFREYSEYEFWIDGELYYKMSTSDVLGRI